jgi:hypothetical protein
LHSCIKWDFNSSDTMSDFPQSVSGQMKVRPLHVVWWDPCSEYLNSSEQSLQMNLIFLKISSTKLFVRVGMKSYLQLGHVFRCLFLVHSVIQLLQQNLLHLLHSTISGGTTLKQIIHIKGAAESGFTAWSGWRSLHLFWLFLTCFKSFSISNVETWKRDS